MSKKAAMDTATYRKLTGAEIARLEANGCSAVDWSRVEAAEAFVPDGIEQCRFAGTVRLGKNVTINGIKATIENYEIGDNVTILHTESLVCTGNNAFGNGVRVAVLNESGGREVPVYNSLTAQVAYLSAMYRHRPEVVETIEKLVESEIKDNTPELARIGAGSYIAHCGALTDVCTGENAILKGVAELTNGTVNSTADSPTTIGRGVIARNFIVSDSAEVADYAHLEKCFVGQGCRINKGFTAQDCLFFANCECEQGEACAVFAGPYTVTHHKSTLLIGGMFSFYNAGSGTNQSNHMYRLGPIHQGILERGCKTGSGSYILFPARIGAFSVAKGRLSGNPDTSALPFSYLIEEGGKTVLLPGAALKNVGLARDARKWPERERRKGSKNDLVISDILTPYTVGKIVAGLQQLKGRRISLDPEHNGVTIPARQVERGWEIYQTALDLYLGNATTARLQKNKPLAYAGETYRNWSDLAGLIAPQEEIERILAMLPAMHSIHELTAAFTGLYEHYDAWEWGYAVSLLESVYGKPAGELTADDWAAVIEKGISASETLLRWQEEDAAKEFAGPMRASYGVDGGTAERNAEFAAIHGTPESHAFLETLRREHLTKTDEARSLIRSLKS